MCLEPDKIALRPALYQKYVASLSSSLGSRLGYKGVLDTYTFNYVAKSGGSTEDNSAVFKTEISYRQGAKGFSVSGDRVNAITNYLNDRNLHYGSNVRFGVFMQNVDTYRPIGNGGEFVLTTETMTFVNYR
jgi:hypothetical protein